MPFRCVKFMSLSKLPVRTSQYNLKNKLELNYVAEHTLPANNVASAIADMIYNNTVLYYFLESRSEKK